MGSSKSSNRKDRPIINTPNPKGVGGGGQAKRDLNETCPLFIEVKLTNDSLLRKGLTLHIGEHGEVTQNGRRVGSLTATQHRKVVECEKEGYKYRGTVMEDKKKRLYGSFERNTS